MVTRPVFLQITQTALVLLLAAAASVPGAWAQADVQGQWSTLPYSMTINPIHVALMHNGTILVTTGSGNCPPSQSGCPTGPPYGGSNHSGAAVLDPVAKSITQLSVGYDMFCNGMTVLPDGRVFINGGTVAYDPFLGSPQNSVFDPATNSFTALQNMAHGRWYPTVITLGDGRVMTFSGSNETTGSTNNTVEFYTVGGGWSQQYTASWVPPLYPRLHLLPNGKVFASASQPNSHLFNPATATWTLNIASTKFGGTRTYGSSVLLPLTPDNSYDPQVMILGGDNPATATTELIDLGSSSPSWQWGPDMSQARIEMDAVMLPTGKVLAVGGSSNDENASTASLNADLYDPASNSFSSAGANVYARLYHTVALLLPDATVWLAGSNPSRGTYETHMEIYQPAYLFTRDGNNNLVAATRPAITNLTGHIGWGSVFTVSSPDAASVSQVVLVRPGSSTHGFDMDQRLVGMSFTAGSGTLTVTAPPNSNIAPPGYYMLFLINNKGVPSVASFLLLDSSGSGSAPAPTVSAVSPSAGGAGTAVTITGTNFASGATASFGGTAATNVTVVSSTSITATTPAHAVGAVNIVVTNTDGQNGTLSGGYTYSNPAPTVSGVSPTSGSASGGTAVTITGTNFVSGATVSFGGTAATGVSVTSSTSIAATTPAHTAGAVSVTVMNSDDQSASLPSGYTYTGPPTVGSISPNSGSTSGGAAVTITGTNFAAGATVSFGGTAATGVTVSSGTSITATTPAHAAGAVTVMVTNSNGQSGSLVNGYTYATASSTSPTVASVSPNSGSAAGGTAVTITGTNFLTGATVSFGGSAATGVTVTSSTLITATTPAGTAGASVTVAVTNSDLQSGSLANGYTYSQGPDFNVAASVASPTSIPAGGSATSTITVTAMNGFTGAVNLSCSVAPAVTAAPTCAFSPASLPGSGTSTLTIRTAAAAQGSLRPQSRGIVYAMWLPMVGVVAIGAGFTSRHKKRFFSVVLGCLLFSSLTFMTACGGGASSPSSGANGNIGTPPGSYTVSISATGAVTHTASVIVKVN